MAYLANGTRFKVTLTDRDCYIKNLPRELGGRWVALIAAEDDCHLKAAPVQPVKQEPLCEDEGCPHKDFPHICIEKSVKQEPSLCLSVNYPNPIPKTANNPLTI